MTNLNENLKKFAVIEQKKLLDTADITTKILKLKAKLNALEEEKKVIEDKYEKKQGELKESIENELKENNEKSYKCEFGSVTGRESSSLICLDDKRSLILLKEAGKEEYIRIREELDKTKIKNEMDIKEMKRFGLAIETKILYTVKV